MEHLLSLGAHALGGCVAPGLLAISLQAGGGLAQTAIENQTLTVELKGSNLQNHFNVIAAGSDSALFIICRANNSATVVLMSLEGQKRQFLVVNGKAVASDQPEQLKVQLRGLCCWLRCPA